MRFRRNLLDRIKKVIEEIDDKISKGKLKYKINRVKPKTSALSSGKIDKYKYLFSKEILPFNEN